MFPLSVPFGYSLWMFPLGISVASRHRLSRPVPAPLAAPSVRHFDAIFTSRSHRSRRRFRAARRQLPFCILPRRPAVSRSPVPARGFPRPAPWPCRVFRPAVRTGSPAPAPLAVDFSACPDPIVPAPHRFAALRGPVPARGFPQPAPWPCRAFRPAVRTGSPAPGRAAPVAQKKHVLSFPIIGILMNSSRKFVQLLPIAANFAIIRRWIGSSL